MEKLFERFNIVPNNIEFFKRAFTHASYVNEHGFLVDNERLEFLGDAVLDFVISEYLYNLDNNLKEGEMTKIRATYVCENALFEYAKSLEFNKYILLGKGELKTGGTMRKAILADAFEAFLGAVYLDQGMEKVKEIVSAVIIPVIEKKTTFFRDYKTELQEIVQADKKSITYEIIKEEGPSHDKEFIAVVKLGEIILGEGRAKSKREAEQNAAQEALEKLAK